MIREIIKNCINLIIFIGLMVVLLRCLTTLDELIRLAMPSFAIWRA